MARLYSNENVPLPVVEELRKLGHDVVTSHESGTANRSVPDEAVLEFAISEERVLLTLNRKHFLRIHRATPEHFGIIACTFDPNFSRQAQRVHQAVLAAADLRNQFLRVNRPF